MSSRLTKKSLRQLTPGRLGDHAVLGRRIAAEHTQAADEHGHLRAGEPSSCRPIDEAFLGRHELLALAARVVAEAVGGRLERRERGGVGLFLRGVHAARA
jgi:hypothetical protein